MEKTAIAAILIAVTSLSLSGCGNNTSDPAYASVNSSDRPATDTHTPPDYNNPRINDWNASEEVVKAVNHRYDGYADIVTDAGTYTFNATYYEAPAVGTKITVNKPLDSQNKMVVIYFGSVMYIATRP